MCAESALSHEISYCWEIDMKYIRISKTRLISVWEMTHGESTITDAFVKERREEDCSQRNIQTGHYAISKQTVRQTASMRLMRLSILIAADRTICCHNLLAF